MRGATHKLVAVTAVTVGGHAVHLDPVTTAGLVAGTVLTAKLPDKLGARPGVTLPPGFRWLEHRRSSHWPETCAVFVAATGLLLGSWFGSGVGLVAAVGVLAGYGLHLLADSATPHGIPLGPPSRVVFRLVLRRVPREWIPMRYRRRWVRQRHRGLGRPWMVHCIPSGRWIRTGSGAENGFVVGWLATMLLVFAVTS
jgi:membrane-bound metal-dependent hydrolase YbcI (DUF457 family)